MSRMIKDIKMAFALMPFSLRFKTNLITVAIFAAVGFLIEISSAGKNVMGCYFMALVCMYVVQFLTGLCISDFVQSSPYKKRILVNMTTMCCGVIIFVFYLLLCIAHYVYGIFAGEYNVQNCAGLLTYGIIVLLMTFYMQFVLRKPIIGYIFLVLFVIMLVPGLQDDSRWGIGVLMTMIPVCQSFWASVATGLGILILDLILFNILARLLYRMPINRRMYRKELERAKN